MHRILIAGAGDRDEVLECEQEPELSEVGAGIQMSANAMHGLNHLGLGPQIARIGAKQMPAMPELFSNENWMCRSIRGAADAGGV